jgi:hypothetical protein
VKGFLTLGGLENSANALSFLMSFSSRRIGVCVVALVDKVGGVSWLGRFVLAVLALILLDPGVKQAEENLGLLEILDRAVSQLRCHRVDILEVFAERAVQCFEVLRGL